MSQVFHLFQLQKIDTQIDQIEARLAVIDHILASNEVLSQARQKFEDSNRSLKDLQFQLSRAEDSVQAQRIKIETSESTLYGGKIHNPKELTDLQHEIASLKRHLITLEDHQLELMLSIENAELLHKKVLKDLNQVEAETAQQSSGLIGERSTLLKNKERLGLEREAVIPQISGSNLEEYLRLRSQKHGLAVCYIEDNSCLGCGSTLRPAERQAARSPSLIVHCSSCGRILYAG